MGIKRKDNFPNYFRNISLILLPKQGNMLMKYVWARHILEKLMLYCKANVYLQWEMLLQKWHRENSLPSPGCFLQPSAEPVISLCPLSQNLVPCSTTSWPSLYLQKCCFWPIGENSVFHRGLSCSCGLICAKQQVLNSHLNVVKVLKLKSRILLRNSWCPFKLWTSSKLPPFLIMAYQLKPNP